MSVKGKLSLLRDPPLAELADQGITTVGLDACLHFDHNGGVNSRLPPLHLDTFSTDTRYFEDKASGITLQEVNELTGASSGPSCRFGGDNGGIGRFAKVSRGGTALNSQWRRGA